MTYKKHIVFETVFTILQNQSIWPIKIIHTSYIKIVLIEYFVQFTILPFLWQTQKLKTKSLWVLRKKETLACAIFGKSCYVACTITEFDLTSRDS